MYRHSPVRNQRSKRIKIKHVVQVCLLIAVCFWLIFQLKRSHDKKKEFDAAHSQKISLVVNTHPDEILKFGRKDLQPKLEEETTTGIEMHEEDIQEQEDEDEQEENKHQDEDKIEEEKDNGGGGGGDDEIDENEQEKSNLEIDRDDVLDIIDEDKESEENEEKEIEEKDGQTQTENRVDHDEDGSTEHTHEAREEHYKADDASSAVITHDPGNGTSSENVGLVDNGENEKGTLIQEKDSESMNNATSSVDFHENGPPPNTTTTSTGYQFDSNATVTEITQGSSESNGEENSSKSENLETNSSDPTHVEEEREVRKMLPDIETEGGNSAAE